MIVIYTAIAGRYDKLARPDPLHDGVRYVAFLDNEAQGTWADSGRGRGWEVHDLPSAPTPRLAAKRPKILSTVFVPEADYTLWCDGNYQPLVHPQALIDEYLGNADVAAFKHPDRICAYDEANACRVGKLDSDEALQSAVDALEARAYPRDAGLWCGGFLLRRRTRGVIAAEWRWYDFITRHSSRDQISLPWAFEGRVASFKVPFNGHGTVLTRYLGAHGAYNE